MSIVTDLAVVGPGLEALVFPPAEILLKSYPTERTQKDYAADWHICMRYLREHFGITDPRSVTVEHLIVWRDAMFSRGLKAISINRRLRGVDAVFEQAVLRGIIERNPADGRILKRLPKDDTPVTQPLSDEQMLKLLTQPAVQSVLGARDHAMMLTMALLAVRVSELINLRFCDVQVWKGKLVLIFHAKRGKRRRLPFRSELQEAIAHYLELDLIPAEGDPSGTTRIQRWNGPERATSKEFIFRQRNGGDGGALDRRTVWHFIKSYARAAGIDERLVHPHTFRHTALTKAEGPVDELMAFSGHTKYETLKIYRHAAGDPEVSPAHTVNYGEISPKS